MRRTAIARLALMALAVSAAGAARPARPGVVYILKDLGTLGGAESFGLGVNAAGQVAGASFTASGAEHAFLSGPGGGARPGAFTASFARTPGDNVQPARTL